jgi:primary-amine oxidase
VPHLSLSLAAHPLDPLSSDEIKIIAASIKKYALAQDIPFLRFNVITLKEPPKKELLAYDADPTSPPSFPRQAFCILQTPPKSGALEAVVTLGTDAATVVSWEIKEGVQPLATPDDCFDAEAIVKADPTVQKLLAEKYGITDFDSLVVCDPWSVHNPPNHLSQRRLIQTFMYARNMEMDNAYAHPIDFVPIVDLNEKKVIHIDQPYGDNPPPIPTKNINYHRDLCEKPVRTDLKPLNVVQPDGVSFTVEGNRVKWQNWDMRLSFNYREGLVIHNIGYQDGDTLRPIVHRLSLVEMAVPYADPHEPFTRKCAFDVGDYGLGNCTTNLSLGCDCLGDIFYFGAVLNDSNGDPVEIDKAVCMHEEDAGLLWKHVEYRNMHSEVRRSRRLVLSFLATVVNYEYLFYIHFMQDGTISYQIKLTGELSTNALSPDEVENGFPKYGTMVAEGVAAQFHQHLFCVRIDPAVDDIEGGKDLLVSEVEAVQFPVDPVQNPAGNAWTVKDTPLLTESEAQRIADPMKGRYWKISNPSSLHPITKKPVAWKLMVPAAPLLMATPESVLSARGAFATKSLWVTPYSDYEKWPAGDYTIQSEGGEGLAKFTAADRPCGPGSDPVIWLTLGASHVPRIEDFPVMPCEVVEFHMKPFCFFDGNLGVDVPHSVNDASKLGGQAPCCKRAAAAAPNGNGAVANGHA